MSKRRPTGSPRKALVLGNDTRAFLSVIRSLGRGGVQVHVGNCEESCPSLSSRYVFKSHSFPPYDAHDPGQIAAWKSAFIETLQAESFDLVIPCDDPSLLPLYRHRQELEPHGRLSLLGEKAFAAVFDKFRMNEIARAAGISIPVEVVLTHPEEAKSVRTEFQLPVVLKPRASYTVEHLAAKQFVRKAYTWEELDRLLSEMLAHGPVAVQENFGGEGVGVELLLKDGLPLLAFQHIRLHEPLHGGGSSYRKSVAVSPDLLEASLKILRALDYTGVAMVEFKRNPQTGEWRFLEVNGRFWGSLPLAVSAGADFPLALFRLLVEGQTDFQSPYRSGIYCRNLRSDLKWHWKNLRADRSNPYLATRSPFRDAMESIRNVLLLRERSDTFTWDDPQPGIREVVGLGGAAVQRIRWRIAQAYLQQPWMRRRLWKEAQVAFSQARRILFVCKGNICRSPFAEAIARQQDGDRIWLSAGCYPEAGRRSPALAIETASRWQVDLTPHRSRRLSAALVEEADVLFVFDYENYQTVRRTFPNARGKVHFLGALCSSAPLFIRDPWGGDERDYEAVYNMIDSALSEATAGAKAY